MHSNVQPRILFIVDRPNWAHDFKTRNLMRLLGSTYDIRLRYQSEVTEDDLHEASLIVIYYWLQFNKLQSLAPSLRRNRHKLLVGICSNYELEDGRRDAGLAVIHEFASGVFIHNLLLYREFQPLLTLPTFYTPNGVDTEFYSPNSTKAPSSLLRVGWAGSLTNMGPGYRGYHEFIVPAVAAVDGVELLTAAREDKLRGPEEMRDFYRSLDLYICASRFEGTPNPCLEAAACGVPLLTTRVGNMPELVRYGVNGFFIERDVEDIARKLHLLRDDGNLRNALSTQIQQDIQAWDWSLRSRAYRQMFEEMIPKANVTSSSIEDSVANDRAFRVVALMSAYNEEDIIVPCLQSLIKHGLEVYLIDNWSTDSTAELASEFLGKGLIAIEKFPHNGPPSHYLWKDILARLGQVTEEIDADWFLFQDIDEIYTSPWPGMRLRDAILKVDREGFNCIDFAMATFSPVDNDFPPGADFEAHLKYFEFSDRPGQFVRTRAWKNLGRRVSLTESGGHEIRFKGRCSYSFRFLLKHYPVRSQAHGEKKIFRERKARWFPKERASGWHTHYDHISKGHSFVRQIGDLQLFNESEFDRLSVHNGLQMIDWGGEHIKALRSQPDKALTLLNLELKAREESVQSLIDELRKRKPEAKTKRVAFNELTKQLAERDKNIKALVDQVAKRRDAIDELAAELAETRKIILTLVNQLAIRYTPTDRKRNQSPLTLLHKKLIHRLQRFYKQSV